MKYRKKPIEVEAIKWTGENNREMWEFLGGSPDEYMSADGPDFHIDHYQVKGGLIIKTSEGNMIANIGDYIIKEPFDKERKYYPCKPDIFELTYDVAGDTENNAVFENQQHKSDFFETNNNTLLNIKAALTYQGNDFPKLIEQIDEQIKLNNTSR